MVRGSSSHSKRSKAAPKHNYSHEAPANLNFYSAAENKSLNPSDIHIRRPLYGNHSHSHSLSSATQHFLASHHETIGLTSAQAIKKLIEEIDSIISKKKTFSKPQIEMLSILRYAILTTLSVFYFKTGPFGWFCMTMLVLEVVFIELVEKRRGNSQTISTIKAIRHKLRNLDKSLLAGTLHSDSVYSIKDFKVPITSATSYVRVIRDGKIRMLCLNLLVPGDLVVLLAGEKTASFSHQSAHPPVSHFQRRALNLPPDSSIVQVKDFPAAAVIQDQLRLPRRTKFVFKMLHEKLRSILSLSLPVFSSFNPSASTILIIITSPLLEFIWWITSTCYLSLVSKQLISSKTPFKEAQSNDVDEFDEDAPPPVKNIKIPFWKIGLEVFKSLIDAESNEGAILRFWDGDVIEALALISVLCFTDREGPISNCHSRPCELIVPMNNESELVAVELIPKVDDPQRVRPALNNNSFTGLSANDLRAIGLSMLLSAACGGCKNGNPHCRNENVLSDLYHFVPEYLQTCYCNLAKEIGFDLSVLNRFKAGRTIWHQHALSHHKKSSSISILYEDQNAKKSFEEFDGEEIPFAHLFTFGGVGSVLKMSEYSLCKDFSQEAAQVNVISESLRRKLVDFETTMRSCDVRCVAFAYRPIFSDEMQSLESEIIASSGRSHIFLGLISVCPEPKQHFQEFIDDLEAAGVRFAYFSPYREQASKAFGERLGLETDWNSCILLSEHPNPASQSPGYSALSDIKAKLPRGIQAIRPHLESVDDIPLHVSIFAECTNSNSSEMMKIYQEWGEVVGVIGSVRSIRNSQCFGTAHLAIGNDSFPSADDDNFDQIALQINANSVKLILPADSSPYIITELIREARTILQNTINAWEFVAGSLLSIFLVLAFENGGSLTFPNLVSLCCSVLFVGFGIVGGPYDSLVMKTHSTVLESSKCPEKIGPSFFASASLFTAIRFIPALLFSLLLRHFFAFSTSAIFTLHLIQSISFFHSHNPIKWKNFICFLFEQSSLSFTLLAAFFILLLNTSSFKDFAGVLLAGLIGILGVTWNEIIKSILLRDFYEDAQKRAKLLFNTKLGMHSPV